MNMERYKVATNSLCIPKEENIFIKQEVEPFSCDNFIKQEVECNDDKGELDTGMYCVTFPLTTVKCHNGTKEDNEYVQKTVQLNNQLINFNGDNGNPHFEVKDSCEYKIKYGSIKEELEIPEDQVDRIELVSVDTNEDAISQTTYKFKYGECNIDQLMNYNQAMGSSRFEIIEINEDMKEDGDSNEDIGIEEHQTDSTVLNWVDSDEMALEQNTNKVSYAKCDPDKKIRFVSEDQERDGDLALETEKVKAVNSFKGSCEKIQHHCGIKSSINKPLITEDFNCAFCSFNSKDEQVLIRHFRVKHDKSTKIHKCIYCPYETDNKYSLKSHIAQKHSKDIEVHKCNYCSYETTYKSNLKTHIGNKHSKDTEVHRCSYCTYESMYKSNVKHHIVQKHSKHAVLHKCTYCAYETKNKYSLKDHIVRKHSKDTEVHKCNYCSYETTYKSNLTSHIEIKHSKDIEVHRCTYCPYESIYKSNVKQHIIGQHCEHTEVRKCAYCPYETKNKYNLKGHIVRKHSKDAKVHR